MEITFRHARVRPPARHTRRTAVSGVAVFSLLLVTLLGMAWGFRTLLLGVIVANAERGTIIPVSLTLARVPVPAGESFCLSLPARREHDGVRQTGSLVLTTRRLRLVRRGAVVADIPLGQVEHLTVRGFSLCIAQRGTAAPLVVRIAQPAAIARYIRHLAIRGIGKTG